MPDSDGSNRQARIGRRTYLKSAGVAALVGLAGCSGDGGDGGGDGGSGDGGDGETDSGGDGGDGGTTDSGGSGGGTITLGALNPFSGGLGWIGGNARRGYNTALHQINDNSDGVLDGMTIEINEQDSQTNPQEALSGFETLAANDDIPGIVGPSSSTVPNLVQPVQDAEIPLITIMAGTIQLDDIGGEWFWRNVPSDAIGGRAAARYSYEELGHETMALAFKDDRGSQSFSLAVGEFFENLGGEVVNETPLALETDSYRSEIQTLIDADPDIVQMTAGTEISSLFINNYTELGAGEEFNLTLSNDVLTADFIETVGADVIEGMVGQAPAPGPSYEQFAEAHQEVTDSAPGTFGANAYDAVNQFALAWEAHGAVERQAIPEQLTNISNPPGTKVSTFAEGKEELANGNDINYHGAGNPQDFDDNGNVLGPFQALQAVDGEWTPQITYSAEQLAE